MTVLPPDINGTNDICQPRHHQLRRRQPHLHRRAALQHLHGQLRQPHPGSPLVSDINCMRPGGATDYADAMAAGYNELNSTAAPASKKSSYCSQTAPPT